ALRLGSAEPPGVPEAVVGQATLGIGNSESAARSEDPDSTYVLVPKALEISASVAFSASLTCTPPPPDDASATLRLMSVNQALKADASPGALAVRIVDTSRRISSEPWTMSAGLAPVNRSRSAFCTVDRPSGARNPDR